MIKLLYIALMAILGAIIVHIILLFLYPIWEEKSFWAQIEQVAPANKFAPLPANSSIMRMSDPIIQLRLCHFDLTTNPIHFSANGNVPFWSLSIYNKNGDNLYSINDRTSPEQILDLVLGDPIQIMDYRQTLVDKIKRPVLTQQNIAQGFAVLRVLQIGDDWQKNIKEFLNTATCNEVTN